MASPNHPWQLAGVCGPRVQSRLIDPAATADLAAAASHTTPTRWTGAACGPTWEKTLRRQLGELDAPQPQRLLPPVGLGQSGQSLACIQAAELAYRNSYQSREAESSSEMKTSAGRIRGAPWRMTRWVPIQAPIIWPVAIKRASGQ